ncbi:MAG TPA: PAS domain-containing protein, partial [Burkholderiaceae bacterium]|nr:PAS domain-containing protein [Burkholderiaceae bacterium]
MRGALVTLFVACLVFLGVLVWKVPEQTFRLIGPVSGMVLTVVSWWVMARRGVVAAKQVLAVGGFVVTLALGFMVAGVMTPVLFALPMLVMLLGFLFSPRLGRWATGISVVALWCMVLGAEWGWIPDLPQTTPAMFALIQTLMLVLTAYTAQFVSDRYRDRVKQATGMADELTRRTLELETSQARLQLAIDASETVFWEYDIQADVLSYEEKSLSVLSMAVGYAPTQVRDWVALVHPDDKDLFVQQFRDTIRDTVAKFGFDYRMQGHDKTWVWITVRGAVVRRDAEGKPTVLGGAARSIQDRKAAEAALQASEAQARHAAAMLRSLCDNVPDMIWAKDLNKRYLFANRAICDQLLMAISTEEPVGKDDMYFALRERNSRPYIRDWHTFGELCQDSDAITLENGQPSQFEEFGHVRGRMLVLDVNKAPFRNEKGEVIGVVGTGRNIT